jgi:hypothetical protein
MSRNRPRGIYTSSRRRRGPGLELVMLIILCLCAGAILVLGGAWVLDGV